MIRRRSPFRAAACAALGIALGIALGTPLHAAAPDAGSTAVAARPAAITSLSVEQRAALRAELARYLRQDSEGLVSRVRADGGVSLELDGRYQHAIVARPVVGERPRLACFDDPDAAVAFLARDESRAVPTATTRRRPQPVERDR
jgi:hypothetical protein